MLTSFGGLCVGYALQRGIILSRAEQNHGEPYFI